MASDIIIYSLFTLGKSSGLIKDTGIPIKKNKTLKRKKRKLVRVTPATERWDQSDSEWTPAVYEKQPFNEPEVLPEKHICCLVLS